MNTPTPLSSDPDETVNVRAKYVRLLERRSDGLVSFEFSIGWPELSVDLLLPSAAFDEFCALHQVIWRDAPAPAPASTTPGDQPR
jgi:phenol hydroxylase P0 protein